MSEMNLIVSPEAVIGLLPQVETDLISETAHPPVASANQRDAFARVATATSQGEEISPELSQAAGLSPEDVGKLTAELAASHEGLKERLKAWVHRSDNRIEELSRIVIDRAEALGVSVERYLEKLQRHLLQYVISTYLLDPIPVKLATGPSTLGATSVELQATVALQPSVSAGADVVQGFIASLFNMSFQLTVDYGQAH